MADQRKTIEIKPVTRVEGHGKVTLHLDEKGNVSRANLNVLQLRGFEKFCEGRVFWEMPLITQRACGICPVSHHLASAKAGDAILGVEIPPAARMLRQLMHMAQYAQSHALHFFHLASPDLLLGMDANPAIRNVIGLIEANPELAKKAVWLRSFGQTIIETLGTKKVHPNFAIPGGVNTALAPKAKDEFLSKVSEAIAIYRVGLDIIKDFQTKQKELMASFASFPSAYMGLVDPQGNLELYEGKLRLIDPKGFILEDQVDGGNYLSIIEERVEDWSYMKFPCYKKMGYPGGMYRVGPLARLNVADGITTPLASKEFKEFKKLGNGGMVEGSLYFHYARLIEGLYAVEMIGELLKDDTICSTEIRASSSKYNEEGIGVLEAPRGTLFHHFWVDPSGAIRKANIIVATQNNNLAINRAIYLVAKEYVKAQKLTEGMLNRVEVAIRCYDPCLSCATHALGQMPLSIQVVDSCGKVLEEFPPQASIPNYQR
ncbi:MAG: Ni/Fe hydrogenase subunit alpha [Chloroflexi bacterium]|nr:Ni/Fe hydrogenase subunit alpha [Chloroflexota bacterium]MBM4451166.1 Ni/Fe hydrogenase subunit alpha [Chloroflexota bacterium]MBM4453121.1 Ni/Fe hydrogenase subunit alpha [Chloroflexota bacterium]